MNRNLRALATVIATLFVASCQISTQANKSADPKPVATTAVADTEGILPRFTRDIWPAITAYRSELGQGGPGYQKLIKISAHLNEDEYGNLHTAAQELGQRRREDVLSGKPSGDSDLTLADTSLVELGVESGVIQACYTYTTATYPHGYSQPPVRNPAASEATVELRKTDNWYLYAITNDHVVPGCSASSRA